MIEEHEEPDEREVVTEYGASLRYLPIQGSFRRTITNRYRTRSETYIKDVEVFAQAD